MSEVDVWVAAARAGGGWAFERLWFELAGSVAGYLRTRGVMDSDDVTSEVFLDAFRGLSRFEGDGAAFRSWLFTIAHRRSVDQHRRAVKDQRVLLAQSPTPDECGTEDKVTADLQTTELLALLPMTQREVLWLRFVADLGIDEVAEISGRSVGAVKQLQRRGLQRLRRHLNGSTSQQPIPSTAVITIAQAR